MTLFKSQTEQYPQTNVDVNWWRCSSTDFCGARAHLKPKAPCLRFQGHTQTHTQKQTHPVALFWMNYQPVTEVATYATHKGGNVYRKYDTRSRTHCYSGKAISITYSGCVSVALVMQHEMRMRHIVLSSVACLAAPYSSTFCHKRYDIKFYKNPSSASRNVPFRQTDRQT